MKRQLISQLKREVDEEWAEDRRIEYLKDKMTDEVMCAAYNLSQYKMAKKSIDILYFGWRYQVHVEKILRLQGRILGMKNPINTITDDMIERAKEHPFSELIELKGNRAKCPFHDGKSSTSFSVKDNRGYCFGCSWKGDTIEFVMQKDGMTFPEAVKYLQ